MSDKNIDLFHNIRFFFWCTCICSCISFSYKVTRLKVLIIYLFDYKLFYVGQIYYPQTLCIKLCGKILELGANINIELIYKYII